MSIIDKIDRNRLPRHVAVIMDGNGRWAKERNFDRCQGHVKGVDTVHEITEIAGSLGISYLTLYTFSTENWNRPQQEVDALMNLVVVAIENERDNLIAKNVRLTMIGDMGRMPQFARERLTECMNATAHCTGLTLCLALSYSSRWEMVAACRSIAQKVKNGEMAAEDITEETISANLATCDIPDPDLLIRTGGDLRISNYLLWQIAYSELYFTKQYWPDFNQEAFCEAIYEYQQRERRFGKTSEQIVVEEI